MHCQLWLAWWFTFGNKQTFIPPQQLRLDFQALLLPSFSSAPGIVTQVYMHRATCPFDVHLQENRTYTRYLQSILCILPTKTHFKCERQSLNSKEDYFHCLHSANSYSLMLTACISMRQSWVTYVKPGSCTPGRSWPPNWAASNSDWTMWSAFQTTLSSTCCWLTETYRYYLYVSVA